MDAAEFQGEYDRACLMWNLDPEAKRQKMVKALWEQKLRLETKAIFRLAVDRLCGQDPRHFPAYGELRREIAAVKAFLFQRVQGDAPKFDAASPDEYRQWADECDALAMDYDEAGLPNWGEAYRQLGQHWRMNMERCLQGETTLRCRFSEILKRCGATARIGRAMPTPEPMDFADDGREP